MLASSARIRAVKRRFTRDIGCPNWVVSKSQFRWDCFRKSFFFVYNLKLSENADIVVVTGSKMIQVHGVGSGNDPAHDTEKDAALAVVGDVAQEIDPVVAKRVLRKIDLYFMPAMLIGMHTCLGLAYA